MGKKRLYIPLMTALLVCGIVFLVLSIEGNKSFLAPALGMIVLANAVNLVRIRREKKGK